MKNWRFFVPSPKKTTQSYSFKVRSFYSQSYRSCWKRSLFLPQKQENSVKLKFPLKLTIKTASWTICKKWCQQTPNNNKKHTCSTLILHLPGHNQKKGHHTILPTLHSWPPLTTPLPPFLSLFNEVPKVVRPTCRKRRWYSPSSCCEPRPRGRGKPAVKSSNLGGLGQRKVTTCLGFWLLEKPSTNWPMTPRFIAEGSFQVWKFKGRHSEFLGFFGC